MLVFCEGGCHVAELFLNYTELLRSARGAEVSPQQECRAEGFECQSVTQKGFKQTDPKKDTALCAAACVGWSVDVFHASAHCEQ